MPVEPFEPNMLGAYGPWAASLAGDGPGQFTADKLDDWRRQALARLDECLLSPDAGGVPQAEVQHKFEYDGLSIEHLSWQLPYGPPTEAVLLKPANTRGRLPGVLALHDHGGNKYFGWRKIAQLSDDVHPIMRRHRDDYYGGVSWANELAKRGYEDKLFTLQEMQRADAMLSKIFGKAGPLRSRVRRFVFRFCRPRASARARLTSPGVGSRATTAR